MSASVPAGARVGDVAWPEVETRLQQGALAVLPVGAGAKEHGPHLPLATDLLQAEWLMDRLIAARDVLVWPTLSYGFYPAFVDYPGSISIARDTFTALVGDILLGICRAGASRVAVVNTGISTKQPLTDAMQRLPARVPARLVDVYAGPALAAVESRVIEQAWGGHADELETSIMLAIAPARVDMHEARAAPARISAGPFNRTDPAAPNYSPAGVTGDPTRATRAKGEHLLAAMLRDLLAAVDACP